ncbi:hypothetical protein [Mesoplasma lactucae]|uniref:Uncharacterized protein n=1 Tax=Mesoplasma lactucae ATCC 49193 TaxID=81460 RepID=A0A291IR15_9MOLU|nr:hypothetical protein [Mesoplasma lactucae]ATG97385.1 hypothetical protein CP520_01255 [Mesoplasma lactucae ATCC 49193]ATZ20162.1 hypothetical protein MLACT_v1c03410 [Mesoplasma lactucae ATCC 49193]MCL8216911.1 hypothetical protein [Mesoplasma lactucae ATCC 49193]
MDILEIFKRSLRKPNTIQPNESVFENAPKKRNINCLTSFKKECKIDLHDLHPIIVKTKIMVEENHDLKDFYIETKRFLNYIDEEIQWYQNHYQIDFLNHNSFRAVNLFTNIVDFYDKLAFLYDATKEGIGLENKINDDQSLTKEQAKAMWEKLFFSDLKTHTFVVTILSDVEENFDKCNFYRYYLKEKRNFFVHEPSIFTYKENEYQQKEYHLIYEACLKNTGSGVANTLRDNVYFATLYLILLIQFLGFKTKDLKENNPDSIFFN